MAHVQKLLKKYQLDSFKKNKEVNSMGEHLGICVVCLEAAIVDDKNVCNNCIKEIE